MQEMDLVWIFGKIQSFNLKCQFYLKYDIYRCTVNATLQHVSTHLW